MVWFNTSKKRIIDFGDDGYDNTNIFSKLKSLNFHYIGCATYDDSLCFDYYCAVFNTHAIYLKIINNPEEDVVYKITTIENQSKFLYLIGEAIRSNCSFDQIDLPYKYKIDEVTQEQHDEFMTYMKELEKDNKLIIED